MDFICEAFDQMQRAFDLNGFNDHQLHCVLRFDSGAAPDAAILRRAVIASIEAIPILGTRYADGAKPRWVSLDPESCARAFVVAPTETDFETVLVARADEDCGPQVRVCLLDGRRSAVALTLNHMICHAAQQAQLQTIGRSIVLLDLAFAGYGPNAAQGGNRTRWRRPPGGARWIRTRGISRRIAYRAVRDWGCQSNLSSCATRQCAHPRVAI